jgi:hypothetical protein
MVPRLDEAHVNKHAVKGDAVIRRTKLMRIFQG